MSNSVLFTLWSRPQSLGRKLTGFLQRSAVVRSRRALGRLDDHLLRDIGVGRADALAEAARPNWDVLPHWRR